MNLVNIHGYSRFKPNSTWMSVNSRFGRDINQTRTIIKAGSIDANVLCWPGMTSAERRALDGSSIYPVARARNVCFCQRPPRERERTREKEIILALARNYATIQVLNAYNLFRVATARVSHRPVSERRGGRGKIGEQRGWRVADAHTACSPVISRRVRKRSTHA